MTETVRSREHTNNLEKASCHCASLEPFFYQVRSMGRATPMLVHVPGSISESVPVLSSL